MANSSSVIEGSGTLDGSAAARSAFLRCFLARAVASLSWRGWHRGIKFTVVVVSQNGFLHFLAAFKESHASFLAMVK